MASSVSVIAATILALLLLWTRPGYGQEIKCLREEGTDVCEDSSEFCREWSNEGQCKSNAVWMLSNCPQSCQRCDAFDIEDFNMAVFKEVSLNTNSSIFISPYSIWSAFIMAYFGSKGTTQEQLQAALGVRGKNNAYTKWKLLEFFLEKPYQQTGATFRSLNKAYFDKSIKLKKCISELIHNLEEVNFSNKTATADLINAEVRRTTEGMIPKLINPKDLKAADFLLLNAVYFKGKWETPFYSRDTKSLDFFDEQKENKVLGKVSMMHGLIRKVQHVKYDPLGAEIIELPYDNSSISMILIKPYWDVATLDSVLSNLTSDNLQDAMNQMITKVFNLGLPKFRMETRIEDDLKKAMNALGVSEIFTRRADLSGFSNSPVKIDKVIHEAVVEVNEEGTTAAAATALVPTRFGSPALIMNKPFIYLIHDKSANVTLFAGTFRHPDDAKPLPKLVNEVLLR